MHAELNYQQWMLLIAIFLVTILIAQISIRILRKRKWFLSILLLLILSAGMTSAFRYYRSIHAPEIIVEKVRTIGRNITQSIENTGKRMNNNAHGIAGGYSIHYDDVESADTGKEHINSRSSAENNQ